MIKAEAVWMAVEPLDMRAGTDAALVRVVAVFGAAKPHHGYRRIRPEGHFESPAAVVLIAEGYDAAIGGDFELVPAHIIAVASPAYLARRAPPGDPSGLIELDGVIMCSLTSSRIRTWNMRNAQGDEVAAVIRDAVVVNDPAAPR